MRMRYGKDAVGQGFLLKVLKDWECQPNLESPTAHYQRFIKDLYRPRLRAKEQSAVLPSLLWPITQS